MKRTVALIFALILVLVAVFPLTVSAKTIKNIEFSVGEDFTVHTDDDLLASSNVDGLIFAAISKDNKHQIQARCTTTEFSTRLKSFYGLDREMLEPVGNMIFPKGYETANINSLLYLKNITFNDKEYTCTYITVNDGKLYTFTYFGCDPTKIGEFMATVKLPDSTNGNGVNVYIIILISVFILVDIAFIIFLAISFVKDYKHHKMETSENIVSNYVKIKRRKF